MFNNKFRIGVLQHPGYNKGKGGGGSSGPTSSTSYSTNVPEYARPYVENMLNAAQAQIYNPDMTGFNPYTPYSSNVNDYIAGFSPMQQQAFSTAANMKVPGQYGLATRGTLGAMAGLGDVESGMANVGSDYARMATSPYAMSAYMNPYVSASLAPQLQLANQQYDIAGQRQQSQAAQQGAFGGTREALMNAANRQNQMLAQNQLISQGYNRAFDTAQQAQQFGANLGLQGLQGQLAANQAFMGGANQLAGIGGAQLAAQQGIANLQNQYGQQQQALEQNKINQAVQDYATAQQYPFMQLGLLNSMLRGLPMQQSSTQMYQAAPNPISQIAGLGATAYGLFGGGKKEGGVIKAAGGIPMSHFSKEQLDKVQQSPYSTPLAKMVATGELGIDNYVRSNPEAKNLFAQNMQQLPQMPPTPVQTAMMPQTRSGLDSIGTGEMTQMAGGGLLAFVGGGDTSYDGVNLPTPGPNSGMGMNPLTADPETLIRQELISERPESEAAKAQREALEKSIAGREKQMGKDKWTMLGLNLLAQTGPFAGVNLGNAGKETLKYIAEQEDLTDKDRKELLKFAVEQDKNKLTRDDLLRTGLLTAQTQKDIKELQLANLRATQKNTQDYRDEQLIQKYAADFGSKLDAEEKRILAAAKYSGYTPEYIRALAYNNVVAMSPKKMLDILGKQPIPKDQMPPPKAIRPPEPPGFLDRAGDYLFGNKPAPAAAPAGPKAGDTKVIGGVTYGYDGKGWLPQ